MAESAPTNPPAPIVAIHLAEIVINSIVRGQGPRLDYSEASIANVDAILERFRDEGNTSESMPSTVTGLGCYVGEVLVRKVGAKWSFARDVAGASAYEPDQLVLVIGGQFVCNPIGKAMKCIDRGATDTMGAFFEAALEFAQGRIPRTAVPHDPQGGASKAERPWWKRLLGNS